MARVLFVDDEPNVLCGLRRMLRCRAAEWHMEFVASGQEALARLAQEPFDVLVSDMRMPGIDGPTLLAKVKEQWPEVVRIVLSGQSDSEAVMRSAHAAHQYLAKPCSAEILEQTIARSLRLQTMLNDHQLAAVVSTIDQLPTLPETYRRIVDALRSQKLSVRELGGLIEHDIALSAKVLHLVNSAFFGVPRHVSTPGDAAVMLGVDVLSALVLGTKLFSLDDADAEGAALLAQLSTRALHVAIAAKRFALEIGCDAHQADSSFLAGMMHDLGELVLLSNHREEHARCRASRPADLDLAVAQERERFGATHGEIGGYLLGLWGFDNDVVEAVAFHHQPTAALPPSLRPLIPVHIAVSLVERFPSAPDVRIVRDLGLEQRLTAWQAAIAEKG